MALAAALLALPAFGAAATPRADAAHHLWPVRSGDTLIGLGRRLLVEPGAWRELARINGLADVHRIRVGSKLRIPLALLRSEAVDAAVLAAAGSVRAGDAAAVAAGATLAEGSLLSTGADGGATVRLVDGTVLRLRASSSVRVDESRRYPDVGQIRSTVELREGRIEVRSPTGSGGQPGFSVRTPQGVLAVRGTEFRAGADATDRRSRSEVLEGVVAAEGSAGGQQVEAGFGAVIEPDGRVPPPVRLLEAPDTAAMPALHERPLVRLQWPALAGAVGYRGQIARDAGFDRVLGEHSVDTPLLRLADLADGEYHLRLRGRDERGLEGRNADHRFVLKARPEPPLPRQPSPGSRVIGAVTFAWATHAEAASYRLQVARDPGFRDIALERDHLAETQFATDALPPGRYHWRLRSVRADGDAGPQGDPIEFELRAAPPVAAPPRAEVADEGVSLAWVAQPGQQFDIEIARDAAFTQRVLVQRLAESRLAFEPPAAGRYHLRLRAIEADGYVGPFGAVQFVDVPPCLRTADRRCVRASGERVMTLP